MKKWRKRIILIISGLENITRAEKLGKKHCAALPWQVEEEEMVFNCSKDSLT